MRAAQRLLQCARGACHRARECLQGDEARHEAAYQRIVAELLARDTDAAVAAFASMMQAAIVMPAHLMRDGHNRTGGAAAPATDDEASSSGQESDFFRGFAALADSLGVYTARDYAEVFSHLLKRWRIADLQVCWDISLENVSRKHSVAARQPQASALHAPARCCGPQCGCGSPRGAGLAVSQVDSQLERKGCVSHHPLLCVHRLRGETMRLYLVQTHQHPPPLHRNACPAVTGKPALQVGSGEAAAAQAYLIEQEARVHRMADVHAERCERQRRRGARPAFDCDWLFGARVHVP